MQDVGSQPVEAALDGELLSILRDTFGKDSFRPGQEAVIQRCGIPLAESYSRSSSLLISVG